MTTPPTWTYDASDNAYTLISGNVRCRVWYTSMGNWAAVTSDRGMTSAAYSFATADEAKAWCEQQMAKEQ